MIRTSNFSLLSASMGSLFSDQGSSVPPNGAALRARVDLNGEWDRYLNGEWFDRFHVPSSRRPLGYYQLRRNFLLPKLASNQRAFVRFEGITYHGTVVLNGIKLGQMGPYVPYEFDLTPHAKEGSNQIEVAIADLVPGPQNVGADEIELGVGAGWEGYGGIIRDVYVELRASTFVDNVRFGYVLNHDYTHVNCRAQVFVSSLSKASGNIQLSFSQGASSIAQTEKSLELSPGASETELTFDINAPLLWSPDEPNLYDLVVRLTTEHGQDEFRVRTGFRDIAIRGTRFELNGKPLALNGVCRHDMWKDQGFTLSRQQMEQDMRMIKGLGCNFVRLVHYPHHRMIIDLAEDLGLFVSEEPGYWNMDFKTMRRSLIDLGLQIMERTIRRDWNSPAVFAWLLGNECTLTVDYLKEGKALCNRLDPISRLVSFANSMGNEETKPIFDQAGMDFYDQHTYGYDENKFDKVVEVFGSSRPTTLTEWGWEVVANGEIVYDRDFDRLMELVKAGKIAGHMFWSWQDMRQYSRIDWPTQNGILMSGVVTESREPRPGLYMRLARLFQLGITDPAPEVSPPRILPLKWTPWSSNSKFQPVNLQSIANSDSARKAWADLEGRMADFWSKSRMARDHWKRTGERLEFWKNQDLQIAGAVFSPPINNGRARPLALTPQFADLEVPLRLTGKQLHVLGQVLLPAGLPVAGQAGKTIATYELHYDNGNVQKIPLREGIEAARANLIHEATRLNPVVTASQKVLEFVKDTTREHYQILLLSIPLNGGSLTKLVCHLSGEQPLLLFAMTVE